MSYIRDLLFDSWLSTLCFSVINFPIDDAGAWFMLDLRMHIPLFLAVVLFGTHYAHALYARSHSPRDAMRDAEHDHRHGEPFNFFGSSKPQSGRYLGRPWVWGNHLQPNVSSAGSPTNLPVLPTKTETVTSTTFTTLSGSTPSTAVPTESSQPNFTFDQLWNLHIHFWDQFMYPANLENVKAINSSIIAEDCLGRVDATRNFEGVELNTEYMFGLFSANAAADAPFTLLGVPLSYRITKFVANQNIISSSTIVQFNISSFGVVVPVEIDAWFALNSAGQLAQYDATFKWFDFLVDTMIQSTMATMNTTNATQAIRMLQLKVANSVCGVHQTYCNGTNQQYSNYTQCMQVLTEGVRFGQSFELGRDTLLCRMVHMNMVSLRPSVHCPHIGPSGGGMCADDMTYAQKVLQPYFTHMPFVPYGRQDANATVAAMQ